MDVQGRMVVSQASQLILLPDGLSFGKVLALLIQSPELCK